MTAPRTLNSRTASWLLLIVAVLMCGCRVNRAPMDAAHARRVKAINREYSRDVADNARRWAEVKKQVLELRKYMIEVVPGSKAEPKNPVVNDFLPTFEACKGTASAPTPDAVREACELAVDDSYIRAVASRYYRADFDWVRKQKRESPDLSLEWLATKSHNGRIQASIDRSLAEIRKYEADFRRSLKDSRNDRVELSASQRDHEVEAADRKRRAAWAAAARSFSQAMSSATASNSGASSGSKAFSGGDGECSSDFSCDIGERCVKQYYASTGVCMQSVNKYGGQSYEPHDLDSVGPNTPSKAKCSFGTCSIGFRCDFGSGVCIR